jgi:hypothetical protein
MIRPSLSPVWIQERRVDGRQPIPDPLIQNVSEDECHTIQHAGFPQVLLGLCLMVWINIHGDHVRSYAR